MAKTLNVKNVQDFSLHLRENQRESDRLLFPMTIEKEFYLGNLKLEYATDFFNLINTNRLYLRNWLPWIDSLINQQQALQFIQGSIQENLSHKSLRLGLFHHSKIIGAISLLLIDQDAQTCKIGYWIAESYQGKGLITKACRMMISIAFGHFGLKRIMIECGVENKKSRSIPQRLGFKAEKIIQNNELINGHYIDHMEYVMDWQQWVDGNNIQKNSLVIAFQKG